MSPNPQEKEHFVDVDILGVLQDAQARVIEADLMLTDQLGSEYAINVMTLNRYEWARAEQPDLGYDQNAPKIFVANEAQLSLDAIQELLTSAERHVFDPYVYQLTEENS